MNEAAKKFFCLPENKYKIVMTGLSHECTAHMGTENLCVVTVTENGEIAHEHQTLKGENLLIKCKICDDEEYTLVQNWGDHDLCYH